MATPSRIPHRVRFGEFELDLSSHELWTNGTKQTLAPQLFQMLQLLIENRGQIVPRDTLVRHLWPSDTFVDYDQGLKRTVKRLREALNDSVEQPRFIETFPRQGYRFIADVEVEAPYGHHATDPIILRPHLADAEPIPERAKRKLSSPYLVVWVLAGVTCAAAVWFWRAQLIRRGALPQEPKLTQATANSAENPIASSAISPDGKYLAFIDNAMKIRIQLLATGEIKTVPQPQGLEDVPVDWTIAAWFPDSTRFVVNAHPPDNVRFIPERPRLSAEPRPADAPVSPASGIWVVSLLGQAPQQIREDDEAFSVSPDGSSIAFGTGPAEYGDREVWLMNATGLEPRKLFDAADNSGICGLAWSRDGQRVVYFEAAKAGGKLVSRDLRGGPPISLVKFSGGRDLTDFVWMPDGQLIYSLRSPARRHANLWEVRVDPREGVPLNSPRQLTNWTEVGIDEISATADGHRLALQRASWQTTVHLANLKAGGSQISSLRRLTLNEHINAAETWTTDSRALVFRSIRDNHLRLFLQAIDSDTEQPLVMGAGNVGGSAISPDGQWLFYQACEAQRVLGCENDPMSIMAIPLHGGASHLVLRADTDQRPRCTVLPGNLCFVTERTADKRHLVLTAFDALKGRGPELARFDVEPAAAYTEVPSPDGSCIAIKKHWDNRIHIIFLNGQPAQEITIKHWTNLAGLFWAADGKGWYTLSKDHNGVVLLYIDLQGEAHPLWDMKGNAVAYGLPSPDGRHLAIVATSRSTNVWVVESF